MRLNLSQDLEKSTGKSKYGNLPEIEESPIDVTIQREYIAE